MQAWNHKIPTYLNIIYHTWPTCRMGFDTGVIKKAYRNLQDNTTNIDQHRAYVRDHNILGLMESFPTNTVGYLKNGNQRCSYHKNILVKIIKPILFSRR